SQLLALQHKAMLDTVRCDVTARHNTIVVDLPRIGRGCSLNFLQYEGLLELSSLPSVAQPGTSIGVEIVADEEACVIASLLDAIHDVSVRVLDKFDLARRSPEEFLAEDETRYGEPGDGSIIEDEPRLGLCPVVEVEGGVVAAVRRAIEPVQDTA